MEGFLGKGFKGGWLKRLLFKREAFKVNEKLFLNDKLDRDHLFSKVFLNKVNL